MLANDGEEVVGGAAQVQEQRQPAGAREPQLHPKVAALRLGIAKLQPLIIEP